MFAAMAVCRAKPETIDDLFRAAQEHGDALRRQPGCVAVYVLREVGAPDQLSLSIFESKEALDRAVAATTAVITKHHLERLVERPPEFHQYEVTGGPSR